MARRARAHEAGRTPEQERAQADGGGGLMTVSVRSTVPRRYRAGLGPFGADPVTLAVTPEQLDALRADAMLILEEA